MRQRRRVVLPALAAAGVLTAAVTVGVVSGDDPASAPARAASHDDPTALDVLVLVPDSPHAAEDRELVTEAVGMWRRGIDAIADEPDLGWLRDAEIRVTAEPLPAGADGSAYTLRDPEIVIVAATPPGAASDATGAVDTLMVRDADDAACETVSDPFAYDSWSGRPGFRSHHSLPEGTWLQDCGGAGGQVCYAVNATLTPAPPRTRSSRPSASSPTSSATASPPATATRPLADAGPAARRPGRRADPRQPTRVVRRRTSVVPRLQTTVSVCRPADRRPGVPSTKASWP